MEILSVNGLISQLVTTMHVCSELRSVLPVSMMMSLLLAVLVQIKVHPKYLSTTGKLPPFVGNSLSAKT